MTDLPPSRPQDQSAIAPRSGIVALVVLHLVLAIWQTWTLPAQQLNSISWELSEALVAAQEAVPQAQIALIAVYMILGSGGWLRRIIRGVLLLLWLELGHMIGTVWLAAGRDAPGFMFFLGNNAWHLLFYLLPLLLYHLFTWRRLAVPSAAAPKRFQFRIWHLLIVTTEAAALLAALRIFLADNRHWPEELWMAIRDYPFGYASYDLIALVILATVPTILITLRWQSIWRGAIAIVIWQLLLTTGFVIYRALLPELDPQFRFELPPTDRGWLWLLYWLNIASTCLALMLVIWPTLIAVRWLGYEFLPLRRGGRQSSADTSAA